MRVNDRADIGTCLVDAEVKRKFRRRRVNALPGAVRREIDDVARTQAPLVHPGRSDPHPAVFVADRNVPARGGGSVVTVSDAFHDRHDLIQETAIRAKLIGFGRL